MFRSCMKLLAFDHYGCLSCQGEPLTAILTYTASQAYGSMGAMN